MVAIGYIISEEPECHIISGKAKVVCPPFQHPAGLKSYLPANAPLYSPVTTLIGTGRGFQVGKLFTRVQGSFVCIAD